MLTFSLSLSLSLYIFSESSRSWTCTPQRVSISSSFRSIIHSANAPLSDCLRFKSRMRSASSRFRWCVWSTSAAIGSSRAACCPSTSRALSTEVTIKPIRVSRNPFAAVTERFYNRFSLLLSLLLASCSSSPLKFTPIILSLTNWCRMLRNNSIWRVLRKFIHFVSNAFWHLRIPLHA